MDENALYEKITMLKIEGLAVTYRNTNKTAFRDISLNINRNEHLAILGPSGSGKTTLLRIIGGILREPQANIQGSLDWRENEKRPSVRMVFQNATLIPWRTVAENISYGLEALDAPLEKQAAKIAEVLGLIGLSEFKNYYPNQLSIGMQQRVNFARALVCEPDLLLMDEPFSSLDNETKKSIQNEFKEILCKKNITSILVTHSPEEAEFMSDKIVVLGESPTRIITTRETIKKPL